LSNPIRLRMVDDLLRRHQLQGMSVPEIESLLGPADRTEKFRNYDMVYWLGPERGFMSIDSEWLVFRLDDKKKVSAFSVVRD